MCEASAPRPTERKQRRRRRARAPRAPEAAPLRAQVGVALGLGAADAAALGRREVELEAVVDERLAERGDALAQLVAVLRRAARGEVTHTQRVVAPLSRRGAARFLLSLSSLALACEGTSETE